MPKDTRTDLGGHAAGAHGPLPNTPDPTAARERGALTRPPSGAAADPSHQPPLLLSPLSQRLVPLKQRIVQEATTAIGMLESALEALCDLDSDAALAVRRLDDQIDQEEVHIEEACYKVLALQAPVARDLRTVSALLRINADLERVADHASSVAKITMKLSRLGVSRWPTSLLELRQRVPMLCHLLLRALREEDAAAAREILVRDKTIDTINRELFDEVIALMEDTADSKATGLLFYRAGRELERVADLMKNIAEDVVYLVTGVIIRHEKRRSVE